jgi:hypothetical protein
MLKGYWRALNMSKQPKPFETWVIRNKNTGEFFVAPSGKNSWKAKGHAKNAWASLGSGDRYYNNSTWLQEKTAKYQVSAATAVDYYAEEYQAFPYFDEQDTWELIELGGSVESLGKQLKKAGDLLSRVLEETCILEAEFEEEILRFLESVK